MDYLGLDAEKEKKLYQNDESSFVDDIVFAIETFAYVNYSFLTIDTSSEGYLNLYQLDLLNKQIVAANNKKVILNENDIKTFSQAFNAFQNCFTKVLYSSAQALPATNNLLNSQINNLGNVNS